MTDFRHNHHHHARRGRHIRLIPVARNTVFDQMGDGVIILDHLHRIVNLNPAATLITGITAKAVGQVFGTVLPALASAIRMTGKDAVVVEPFGPAAASVEVRTTPLSRTHAGVRGWLIVVHDITVQQTLARQLRDERDFAQQVMYNMGEGLTVTDAQGRFTFVNDTYAQLLGYRPVDLIGRSPTELTVAEDKAIWHVAQAARKQGQASTYLTRLRCADDRIASMQITGTPRFVDGQFTGSIAVITDVTERMAYQEALRIAEQTLRSFFDGAGVMMGIVELSADDILHVADNTYSADFLGTTVEAMHGQWASTMGVPKETMQRWLGAYQKSAQIGAPVQFDYEHTLADVTLWLEVTVWKIGPTASGISRYSYVATDITARKATELRLQVVQQQLEEANIQLHALARTDGLTGLCNRTAFDESLAEEIVRAMRYQTMVSLLMIDVDHFKPYNDTYGHVAGDGVLRIIAQIFREQARQSDLPARYGGEEFAMILTNTDIAEAMLTAERIRRSVERAPWPKRPITVSIGAATFCGTETAEWLINQADSALYQAKELGRNQVVSHTSVRQRTVFAIPQK